VKITLLTYGSRGDVQPFIALAGGLQKVGHQVKLAAPQRFDSLARIYNVPFVPLAGEPEVISRRLNDAGANLVGMVRAMSDYIFSIADQVATQAFTACEDADLIVHSFLFTTGGHSLARKLHIPDISLQTFPIFAPTQVFPPVSMPYLPSGPISYFFHGITTWTFWYGGNMGFRRLRKVAPGTFDFDLHWPFHQDEGRLKTPLLFAYSPTVVPRPGDWSSFHIYISGYLFLPSPETFRPPPELLHFLSAGKPPICVTFGSMIHRDMERVYRIIFEALGKTGNRAVVLSGWSSLSGAQTADTFVMDQTPHDWLLPRCKAVIHHGGAGATAAGLRAGIPNVVIPFAADQPFWGARVHAIGAGPQPIAVKKLTTEKLIAALIEAENAAIRESAQIIGSKIRVEGGVKRAVSIIEEYTCRG
jgi:sterol 3beta-glucosyltransferase